MLNKQRHKIKQGLLKAMAVLITLCYIIEPVQNELKHMFHFISHNLQAPSYVLQHDAGEAIQSIANPKNSLTNHKHEILNLIDKIIDSSSEKNKHQGKLKNELSSIKKIIIHNDYALTKKNFLNEHKLDNFKTISCLKTNGYSLQLYRPPQLLSNV